jgi:hypothetical protein
VASVRDRIVRLEALLPSPPRYPYAEWSDAALQERIRSMLPALVGRWRVGGREAGDQLRRAASVRSSDAELARYPFVLQCREDLRGLLSAEERSALGI